MANFIKFKFFLVVSFPMKLHILCKQLISMSSSGLLLCMKLGDPKINYKANSLIRDFTFYKANVGAPKLFDRFKWESEVKTS
jgi:hypothetical protein